MKEMLKRGWILPSDNVAVFERQVCAFLHMDDIEQTPWHAHAAYNGNPAAEPSCAAQRAWFYRVRQIAESVSVPTYSPKKLERAVERLKELLIAPEDARRVPGILMECGVKFIIVEKLLHADIDGVCFWIGDQPVIGMTVRKDKIDNFWFVLRHEIEHVLRGHGREEEIIDDLEGERPAPGRSYPRKSELRIQRRRTFASQPIRWILS